MSTPVALLDDLLERLAALDPDDLGSLHGLFGSLADDPTRDLHPPVRALGAALRRATEAEHHHRRTGESYRLDDLAEAIGNLPDADLADGLATWCYLRDEGEGIIPPAMLAIHGCVGQMLLMEGHGRRDEVKVFERDAMSDRVTGWWGDVGGQA